MHEEHRKRVRARFLSEGLDGFEPHNVLELLLFYSIPRQDTNEIAHRLIDRFGSIAGVLDADVSELCSVDGIGERSAVLIKLIPQIARRYQLDKRGSIRKCDCQSKTARFLAPYFTGRNVETVYILFLSASFDVISCELLFEGSVNSARLTSRTIIERAISTHASMTVLAHNHPGGIAVASSDDVGTTRAIYQALDLIDVRLLDHLVFANEKYVSIVSNHLSELAQSCGGEFEYYYTH